MDDYDYQGEWDNWDNTNFEDLGNTDNYAGFGQDYSGGYMPQQDPYQSQLADNGSYNGQFFFDDAAQGTPTFGNMFDTGGGYSGTMANYDSQFSPQQMQQAPNFNLGSIGSALAGLFSGGTGTNLMRAGTTGLAAMLEGQQNKKKQQAMQQLVQNNQQYVDPFGSQRPYYQQQLQNAVADPYGQRIVADQLAAMKALQARKDAAAGRRSNSAGSDPALMAEAAKAALAYQQSLQRPAGAMIDPSAAVAMQYLAQGANAGINGYTSPIASAIGYNQQLNDLASLFGK